MTFDELLAASRAPEKLGTFIECYKHAQADDCIGVQSDLPLRTFAPLMANITLMERETETQLTYRIAGENIINRLGFNPVKSNFIDLLAPAIRNDAIATHNKMLAQPCGNYIVYENDYETGRRMITESLMLPLRKNRDASEELLLGYHAHHEATSVLSPRSQTCLVVNHTLSEFVDIGGGVP